MAAKKRIRARVPGRATSRLAALIKTGDDAILRKTEELLEVSSRLKYEGKGSLALNISRCREILEFFDRVVLDHMHIEEESLFPFLRTHIPRLEFTIRLLVADHNHFERDIRLLRKYLKRLEQVRSANLRSRIISEIHETVTHLFHLVRHHAEVEFKSIHDAVQNDLRRDEKKKLEERLRTFVSKENRRSAER